MHVQLNSETLPHIATQDNKTKEMRSLSIEEYLIYAARVSNPENQLNVNTAPKLLNYLIEHRHWSPFEMVNFSFEIKTSRAIAQQLLRHRSFSFQEFSQRYSEVTNFEPVQLRKAGSSNRQSSTDSILDPATLDIAAHSLQVSAECYYKMIKRGVAKETARMVLPLTTETTIIMNGTLRSWIHFLEQRCSEHAQKEVRDIADAIKNALSERCPWTSAALNWQGEQNKPTAKRERLRELLIKFVEKIT